VPPPVRVRALDGDLALDDVRREQTAQLFPQVGSDPHRDIVEVDEERGVRRVMYRGGDLGGGLSAWSPVYKGALRATGLAALVTMIHANSNVVLKPAVSLIEVGVWCPRIMFPSLSG